MPKTFIAPFPQSQKTASAVASAAISLTGANSLGSDNASGSVLLMTAGAEGAMLTRLTAIPRGTVTASGLYLFLRKAGEAADKRTLIDSMVLPAQTVNATTAVNKVYFSDYTEGTPLRLAPGDELHVGSGVALAVGIAFRAEYTEF